MLITQTGDGLLTHLHHGSATHINTSIPSFDTTPRFIPYFFSPRIFMRISLSSTEFPNPSYKKARENREQETITCKSMVRQGRGPGAGLADDVRAIPSAARCAMVAVPTFLILAAGAPAGDNDTAHPRLRLHQQAGRSGSQGGYENLARVCSQRSATRRRDVGVEEEDVAPA